MNRIIKAIKIIDQLDVDALVLNNESNMHYFCGFSPSEGFVFITKECAYHLVDSRYTETATDYSKNTGLKVIEFNGKVFDEISNLAKKHNVKKVAFENETISLKIFVMLSNALNDIEFVELNDKLSKVRNVKDSEEIMCLKKAQKIAEKGYLELLNHIKIGKTEKELVAEFDYYMAKEGSNGVSFDTILLGGKRTSMPHGVPSDYKIQNGDFVLMDFGATYNGYHSDTTRTVSVGNASEKMQEMYYLVLEAQKAGLNAIKSGVKTKEVYFASYDVLESKQMGKYFRHALGHGVGLDIHEIYTSSPNSNDVYETGNVTSVEPGIYIPKEFGIRIEDTVCVTENGFDNFVSLDKELIIL